MRELDVAIITHAVARLCVRANVLLNEDVAESLQCALTREKPNSTATAVLQVLLENAQTAQAENLPLCQDTGMAVVFVELGQEVYLDGGLLEDAVNAGVALGYERGYLRKSVVRDPLNRVNTTDNTPAVLHVRLVSGDRVKITVAPKGFGSENMSRLTMLKPSDGREGVKRVVLETVESAGPNPCPPIVLGIGVGGTMEKAALLAKEALLKPLTAYHEDPFWAELERELLEEINTLNIGPAGFGGRTNALGVHINTYPTHIAGLPVAVNVGCHVTRHASEIL